MTNRLDQKVRSSNQFLFDYDDEVARFLKEYFIDNSVRDKFDSVNSVFQWYQHVSLNEQVSKVIGLADVDEWGKIQHQNPQEYHGRPVQEPIDFLVIGNLTQLRPYHSLAFGNRPYKTCKGNVEFKGKSITGLAWQPRLTPFEEEVLPKLPNPLKQPYAPLICAGFVTQEEYKRLNE